MLRLRMPPSGGAVRWLAFQASRLTITQSEADNIGQTDIKDHLSCIPVHNTPQTSTTTIPHDSPTPQFVQ